MSLKQYSLFNRKTLVLFICIILEMILKHTFYLILVDEH